MGVTPKSPLNNFRNFAPFDAAKFAVSRFNPEGEIFVPLLELHSAGMPHLFIRLIFSSLPRKHLERLGQSLDDVVRGHGPGCLGFLGDLAGQTMDMRAERSSGERGVARKAI